MVSTEILPRCSRTTNASSDTTCLHFSAQRCATVYLLRSAYSMTCKMQVTFTDRSLLNYDRHLTQRHQRFRRAGWAWRQTDAAAKIRFCVSAYLRKCVKRHRTSSSAPGPACGSRSSARTRCPVSLSTMASFTALPVFRLTNSSGGPASPETAHLSPTCARACSRRMVSLPLRVRTYSYRSGLTWYRCRSINSLSSRCFSRSDKVALVTPVDRRRSSYLASPSDRSRRISTAQRSPIASRTPAIEHAIPSKLFERIKCLPPSRSYH